MGMWNTKNIGSMLSSNESRVKKASPTPRLSILLELQASRTLLKNGGLKSSVSLAERKGILDYLS